ncbi:ABC-F family ATP-binding cassette domain-containing protein [Paenibacillus ginsengarvi]|uniref:ABC transporter ATP-binding protein n=1 Tax=Paenibacillus ginsengarvi TaxID=400777 RepID=A0A3B0CLV7_9BACL|nr:ABC-F family ATP-binding cassette domain-containing protein [Paenibacillus ginsengarvi]RKN84996.1 ABC transporter ATP-binding protein [Paenibacillus ginsengarvi]
MSLLSVEEVTHSYGDKHIFQNISFRLVRGEHAALVGSNGAGKSSLLRLLAGELIPDRGNIEWLPQVTVGYLRQHSDLQPGTTVRQVLQSAFAPLYEIEACLVQAAERMTAGDDRLDYWLARYGEWQNKLEVSGFYRLDSKIEEVAAGLGLTELGLERDVSQLSGGQRTKLLLGKLLLEEPGVLLLDEPTNYLDDVHIRWLTDYLQSYGEAYLVVSHDEAFLNKVASVVYHLENRTMKRYAGNYESFLRSSEMGRAQLQEAYERQQKEIGRLEAFIDKNRIRKAKQAKSREKALERLERIDTPPSAPRPRFAFAVHAEPSGTVLEAAGLQIGYAKPLFAPIRELRVKRGDKIAIVGHNGIGKSTLLRTLLGLIPPLAGEVRIGERVRPAYFAQELSASEQTALDRLLAMRPDKTQKEVRRTLALCGLPDKQIRQPIGSLSGGEQAKVRLCELMLTDSNMLVLDEPTSHLDVRAKEAFRTALRAYAGTIVLVSHEPAFYEDWVTQVWSVENWR